MVESYRIRLPFVQQLLHEQLVDLGSRRDIPRKREFYINLGPIIHLVREVNAVT